MAHRWTNDDDLLVIDLYHRFGALGVADGQVERVARRIGTTPASVALALQNVRYLDVGQGRANYAQHMRVNWERWNGRADELRERAERLMARPSVGSGRQVDARPELTLEQQSRIEARLAARRRDRGR